MNLLLLVNSVVFLFISGLIFVSFFNQYKSGTITKFNSWLAVLGLIYLVPFVMSFIWAFDFAVFNVTDFILISSLVIFFQTLLLFYIFKFVMKSKESIYLLFVFLIVFFTLFISIKVFFISVSIISLILISILLMTFSYEHPKFRRSVTSGVFYCIISIVIFVVFVFTEKFAVIFGVISNALLLVFFYYFIKEISGKPLKIIESLSNERSYLSLFVDYFTFVFVLTTFILMATIGVHELGHVLFANFVGCESKTIVFEQGSYPYTEVICPDGSMRSMALISGPLFPTLISLLLFLFGGKFVKETGLLMFGFNLLASYRDFVELGVSFSLIIASILVGMIFLLLGIVFISKNRIGYKPILQE